MKQQTFRTPGKCSLASALKPEQRKEIAEVSKKLKKEHKEAQ